MAERAGAAPKGRSASGAGQGNAADVTGVTTVTTAQKPVARQAGAAAAGTPTRTKSANAAPDRPAAKRSGERAAPAAQPGRKTTARGTIGRTAANDSTTSTTTKAPTTSTAARAAEGATMAKTAEPKTTAAKTAGAKPARGTRTAAETEKIRLALIERRDELKAEHDQTMLDIHELQQHRLTDSAGDDQADTGTKTGEREQEITIANNLAERVSQVERALERLDEGGYGWCEKCGNAIPVERLAAFPSATLCVTCKQLEERR
jgi:RNA polymerase-binding protein DksA